MEQTDGDADMAREVAQSMLDDKVAELEQAQAQEQSHKRKKGSRRRRHMLSRVSMRASSALVTR